MTHHFSYACDPNIERVCVGGSVRNIRQSRLHRFTVYTHPYKLCLSLINMCHIIDTTVSQMCHSTYHLIRFFGDCKLRHLIGRFN